MNKWALNIQITNLMISTSHYEMRYESLWCMSFWIAYIFNGKSPPLNKCRIYDNQHSLSNCALITRDQYFVNFQILYTKTEALIPALMSDLEHTCDRPSTPRGLKEVYIHTVKGLVSRNVNTLESLENTTTSKRVWFGSPHLDYGIITLTFYLALKSEWVIRVYKLGLTEATLKGPTGVSPSYNA